MRASYIYDSLYSPMVQCISVCFFRIVPYMITTAISTSVDLTLIHYFYLLYYLYAISFPVDLLMPCIAPPTLISSRSGIVLRRHVSLVPFNQKHFHSLSLSFMTLTFWRISSSPSSLLNRMPLILFVWYFLVIRGNTAPPAGIGYEWRGVLLLVSHLEPHNFPLLLVNDVNFDHLVKVVSGFPTV